MQAQAKFVRWLAVLLVVVAVVAFGVSQLTDPAAPVGGVPGDARAGTSNGERVPAKEAAPVVDTASLREERLQPADAQRGESGARPFEVQVLGYEPTVKQARVELLFGDREDLRSVVLIPNRTGTANWPSGSRAPRPWLLDFAFPTAGTSSQQLAGDAVRGELTMPPTCVLDFEVIEIDGRVTSDALTVAYRAPQAMWPANRWRPLHMNHGRAELLAEAAGERIEFMIDGASGRSTQIVCFAATETGERVPVSVPFAPVQGVEITLHDLPIVDPAQQTNREWLVTAHSLDAYQSRCHRLPGAEHRYVFFPPKPLREAQPDKSWLVTAAREDGSGVVQWGEGDAANGVNMRPFTVLAAGRCVDAGGVAVPGYQVDLVAAGRAGVLESVRSDKDGHFQLMGPAHASVQFEALLHGTSGKSRVAAPLPHDGLLTMRVDR